MEIKSMRRLEITVAMFLVFSLTIMATHPLQSAEGAAGRVRNDCVPLSASGDNVYVSWVGNKTGNCEVMFGVSNEVGKRFLIKLI